MHSENRGLYLHQASEPQPQNLFDRDGCKIIIVTEQEQSQSKTIQHNMTLYKLYAICESDMFKHISQLFTDKVFVSQ